MQSAGVGHSIFSQKLRALVACQCLARLQQWNLQLALWVDALCVALFVRAPRKLCTRSVLCLTVCSCIGC
jgi:hypothetical protein